MPIAWKMMWSAADPTLWTDRFDTHEASFVESEALFADQYGTDGLAVDLLEEENKFPLIVGPPRVPNNLPTRVLEKTAEELKTKDRGMDEDTGSLTLQPDADMCSDDRAATNDPSGPAWPGSRTINDEKEGADVDARQPND